MKSTIAVGSNLVLAAGVAILLAIGIAYHLNLADQAEQANADAQSARALAMLGEIIEDGKAAESSTLGFLATRSEQHPEQLQRAAERCRTEIERLARLVAGDAEQEKRVEALENSVKRVRDLQWEAVGLRKQKSLTAAAAVMKGDAYRQHTEEMNALVAEIQGRERRLLTERNSSVSERTRLLAQLTVWGGLMAIALIVFAAVVINIQLEDRRRAEVRLREQEKRYQMVTDALPAMIGYVDTHHRMRYHNKTYRDWLDLPEDRLADRHLSDILGQETYVSLLPRIEQVLRGQRTGYERTHQLRNGGQRDFEATLMPDIDNEGRVHGFFSMVLDATARNRAAEALRGSERLLAETQRVANIGSWASDFTTRKANWSRQVYEIHGIAPDSEYDLNDYLRLIHPEDRERAAREFIAALKTGGADYTQEYRIHRPDGAVRNLLVKGAFTRGASGRAVRALGVIHDVTERKQAEDELRRTKERLELATWGSNDGIWDWDITADTFYFSARFRELLRYDSENAFQREFGFRKCLHPDDLERVLRAVEHHLHEGGAAFDQEYRLRCADGNYLWFRGRGGGVWNTQRQAVRFAGAITDITERKRSLDELERVHAQLDRALLASRVTTWEIDFTTGMYRAKGWIHYAGRQGVLSMTLKELARRMHPEDAARIAGFMPAIVNGRESEFRDECRVIDDYGNTKWLLIHGSVTQRDSAGRALHMVGTNSDISERMRQQDEIKRVNERLDLALHGSRLAIWDGDPTTGNVFLSEGWAEMLGYESKETHTDTAGLMEIAHPEDRDRINKAMIASLKGATPEYNVEHRVRTRSGEWKWILSHGQVVQRDASGRALRITGTNSDISARKEIERMKNEFISVVSHELRTPLTSIVGSLGLLARMGSLSEQTQTLVRIAQGNSHRLVRLINDILDVEKIESGLLRIPVEPVELVALLKNALQANQGYAEQHGASLVLSGDPGPAWVRANTDRLMQVMANLLSNAAKFSPRGAAIMISLDRMNGTYRVTVTDQGPGVPEEFRPRIFGKFAQADSSPSRQTGGTGLGLAISKSIIEKLGGEIGYVGNAGRGAIFYFDLEATADTPALTPERRKDKRPVST